MNKSILLAIMLSLLCSAANGYIPNRKTDTVTFYNGDKLTGEIKQLHGGILQLSTTAMGTVQVEWPEIAKLESTYHYEVRLAEGQRFYGNMVLSERPGEIRISDVYGEHEISALKVVEIRQVSKNFKNQIDLYLSLGFSYNNAGSVGQTTLNTDISYENEEARNALTARVVLSDTKEERTHSSKVDLSRSVWTNRKDVFRLITGTHETNDELGLDYRFSVGGGLGKHFLDNHKMSWLGSAGLQVLTEKSFDGERQESVEAFIQTGFATWKFRTPEFQLQTTGGIYPSLTESGRFRWDGDIKLRWELVRDLYWDITAFGTFDNKAAEDSRFDYGITTGVGWEY